MFAFSAFYKHFTNPIEMRLSAASANFEVTYDNSEESYLYGIEAELRKSLDFIVSGLSLGANYTYVKSVVEIQKDLQDLRDAKTRPMVGQAPYVINTYFSYSNQENGWDANIGFNVSGKKLMLITELATPYIYELPEPALNFNVSKNIGEHLGIEFSADNILNSEFRAVYDYEEYLDHRRYSKGRAFSFGIKYKL
jgi:outer membrane receptor protein involved in Fe transport